MKTGVFGNTFRNIGTIYSPEKNKCVEFWY